jgi:hypothetical protein
LRRRENWVGKENSQRRKRGRKPSGKRSSTNNQRENQIIPESEAKRRILWTQPPLFEAFNGRRATLTVSRKPRVFVTGLIVGGDSIAWKACQNINQKTGLKD